MIYWVVLIQQLLNGKDWTQLKRLLHDVQLKYNEVNAAMNLTLFEDAMHHICRV